MVKETITNKEPSIKKRRKASGTAPESTKPDVDIYKKIVDFEETEAANRAPEKDVALFFETCKTIRSNLAEIAVLKQKGTPEAKGIISEKQVETCLLFAVLKKLNRLEKFRTKVGRDALHQEKLRTDSTKLQLQNLLYELTYLKKEISKCFQFKSMDEEIDLIPINEFYNEAPSTIAKPELAENDPHRLQLGRLEWELQQRKQLANQCHQLETGKQKVANEIVNKQERLNKLAPQLSQILDIIKPLQEHLGLPNETVRQDHHLAHLLPNPLYLLYAKVDAYCQVYDKNTSVHILGEEDEAKQLKDDSSHQEFSEDSESDTEDIQEENSNERKKRHHRKGSKAQKQQDRRDKLIASHPLYIQIKKYLDKNQKYTLILNFYYKIKLHVVTVKCQVVRPQNEVLAVASGEVLAPENLLRELFPNDLGEESPNPTNHYQLKQLELGSFASLLDQLGYPYLWVQRICGLDFIPAKNGEQVNANSELAQSSVESVMQALTTRFRSRVALSCQMNELEKNIIPNLQEQHNVPLKLNGTISQWERVTWVEYCHNASTEKLVAHQHVLPTDMLYRFVITRGSAKLIALVAIKNSFPEEKSIFSVSVNWNGNHHSGNCDALRDIERAVNVDWTPEDKKGYTAWLLTAQIRRLIACFDIYLEISSPEVFPQDKIYFKSVRGRNRCRPYKYLKLGSGVFTQY